MNAAPLDRETARQALRVYMSRTGLALNQIADLTGFSHRTLLQFSSSATFGTSDGRHTAQVLMKFMESHPPAPIRAPGKLYETECTRAIRAMVRYVGTGRWGILYGPAGSQKSFGLECIAAETADSSEPAAVYVECSPRLTPAGLLRRVSMCLGTPFANAREVMLQALLFATRQRRAPLALMIDEAQHLYRAVDTLETVRDFGDKAHGRIGILMVGNEDVLRLFEPRRGVYFEQWRSRIEQKTVRLTGLTGQECRQIVAAELGQLRSETVEALLGKPVVDPETRRYYYSARRLFHSIRDFRDILANATHQ